MSTEFIGRENELAIVHEHLRGRSNLVVFGGEGVGKTALVLRAIADRTDTIYCTDTGTLKTACESLLAALGTRCDTADNLQRKRAVLNAARGRPLLFVFDHVRWVSPKLLSLLENLHESHPMIVVTPSLLTTDIGHLKMIFYDFDKLELRPLDAAHARQLIHAQMTELQLQAPNSSAFEDDLLRLSQGSPRRIVELCEQASRGHYVFGRRHSTQLIELDRLIGQLRPADPS